MGEKMRQRALVMIAGVVVLAVAIKVVLTPASWPEPILRAWLRRQTPFGTSEPVVKQFLERRGFHSIWTESQDSLNRALGLTFSKGTRTIQVNVGEYRSPLMLFLFVRSTEAFYGFDDSGNLVDINVRKSTDAM
jgi:hypothetical protein